MSILDSIQNAASNAYQNLSNQYGGVVDTLQHPGQAISNAVDSMFSSNTAPVTQKINYNPDGTQTHTISGTVDPTQVQQRQQFQMPNMPQGTLGSGSFGIVPQQQFQPAVPQAQQMPQTMAQPMPQAQQMPQTMAQPAVPQTQPVAQPVAQQQPVQQQTPPPNNQQFYNAMAQIETGNNPNAVGAMGERGTLQTLPSTAANPGYGIKPAQDNSIAENDRVSKEHYDVALNKFGDPVLAAAAHNAGIGRMENAVVRAQREGGHPMQYMPASTQKYAADFAQAIGYKPGQTADQNPLITDPTKLGKNLNVPGNAHAAQAMLVNDAGNDVTKLSAVLSDPKATPGIQAATASKITKIGTAQQDMDKATSNIQSALTGDPKAATDMSRALANDKASWYKVALYGLFGDKAAQNQEIEKLLGNTKTTTGIFDGSPYTMNIDADGKITNAWDQSGKAADNKTIAGLQAQGAGVVTKGTEQHAQIYGDPTGQVKGNFVLETRPGQSPIFREAGTGKLASPQEARALKALGVAGTYEQQYQSKFAGAGGGVQGKAGAEGFNINAMPAAPGLAGSPTAAGVQVAQQGAVQGQAQPGVATAPTTAKPLYQQRNEAALAKEAGKAQIKRENAGAEVIAKKSGETVANAAQVQDTIDNAQHAIDLLDSGNHNISPYGPRIQKLEQLKPGKVPEDVTNTKTIMDMVRSIGGAASQAAIKGHLTNQELTFLTENKPDGTDPVYTKQWLQKAITTLQRAQAQAQAQVQSGGTSANPVVNKTATHRFNPATGKIEEIK